MTRKPLGPRLLLYSSLQFVVLSFGAMLFYPGGAMYQPDARGYLFFQNFLSDLGATITRRNQNNGAAMILFVVGLVSVGISLAASSSIWKQVIAPPGRRMFFGHVAQVLAVLAGACYIGIAATPWNLMLSVHMFFVQSAFSLLLAFVFCLTMLQIQNKWPFRYVTSNLIYVAILSAYVFVLFDGPNLETLRGLVFQVVAQKIIVYVSILNLAYQTLGIIAAEERTGPSTVETYHPFETNS
jgi:hypothetical protein